MGGRESCVGHRPDKEGEEAGEVGSVGGWAYRACALGVAMRAMLAEDVGRRTR